MATNCETSIIEYLKTKNGTSTLGQIIQHVKLSKREINQHLYELKRKGKVSKVHNQNPPVWKLIRHSTHFSKLSSIESSGNTETKCGGGAILSNDRLNETVVASPIMHKQERNSYRPTSDGRDRVRARGRRGRRGRGRGRGGGGNQRVGQGIQTRQGNWTDGSEKKFTPSPTADKGEEILRFLLNTKNPASVEEITCNMGSYATFDDVKNFLTKLVDEKKVVKMQNEKYAPNVVKSVEMSLLNDDPSVMDFKTEKDGSSEGASSLGFDPPMEVDEVHYQDGQFSDEDDYDDDDYDDGDDFGLEMKSSEGWGVSSFYVNTESNSDDFESDREVKLGDKSLLSEGDMAPYSDPGSVKQEFVENHKGGKETPSDLLEHETPLELSEVCREDKYEDSGASTEIDMSSNIDSKEQIIKDQVLLAFTKMPLQTGIIFVLETKLNSKISNLEEVLNKLKEKKYVALIDNKVWSLTKNGEDYLASKGLWTKSETPVSMGRGRIFNQKGKGPPQSPLKLITSNTVFSAGVEKPPVAAASYQPAKEQNIQIFPTQSAVVSIPSLMNVDTKNLNLNQSLKTNSNLISGGFLSTSSNVTNSFNKSITSDSLSASDSRMPHTPPMSDGIVSGFQATAPQKYLMPQGKPFIMPQTPAEIARKESEGLRRTDLKNSMYFNSSTMPNHPSSSSNLYIAPSISGQPNTCSSLISTGSSPSLHQSQSSSPMVLSQPTPKSSDSVCSSLLSSKLNDNLTISAESFSAVNKNPISALMEYAQSRHQQAKIEVVSQRGPSHKPTFIIAAMIGQRIFPGVKSGSKKDGRTEAADLALRILLSEGQYNVNSEPSKNINVSSSMNSQMTHFDKIAALSHQAFNQLIASIPEKFAGRKVIAALVLKRSPSDNGTVISVGSGNRCITGEQLSLEGNTVNDSHAEIITRRGFIRFLYKQLETYTINQPHEFFEKGSSGKLRIKPNFTFHLYISTAPCGDGALFSPRDAASNRGPVEDVENHEHNPTFTSNVQGVLRTKMEGGEGTIPIESDFTVQTWDGIVRGERLRTMSCTDKICRWNVVGMQGALLSHLIEPVYLNSLTLGYLYDHGHLSRAVCCRVGKGEPDINSLLPSGFQLNHPWLGRMTACEPQRETQKTKALSINWCLGDERPEVIDGTTGRCYTGVERTFFSRLCKKELYTSFRSVCTKFGLSDLLSAKTYLDAKKMATDFQAAKNVMLKRLKDNGFSIWVSKPMEEEMFSS